MRKNVWNRCLAFVLSAVVMFTSVDMSAFAASGTVTGNVWSAKAGEIVADNYGLDAKVKAVLSHDALAGNFTIPEYSVTVPTDSATLVKVDSENYKVYAKNFTDGEFVWKPVNIAVVVGEATGDKIVASEGTPETGYDVMFEYTTDANNYSIIVYYQLDVKIPVEEQEQAVDMVFDMADTTNNMEVLFEKYANISSLANDELIDGLNSLLDVEVPEFSDGKPTGGMVDLIGDSDPEKSAIDGLTEDYNKEGFDILGDIESYNNAGLGGKKLKWIAANGAEAKNHIVSLYGNVNAIYNSENLNEVYSELGKFVEDYADDVANADTEIAEAKAELDAAKTKLENNREYMDETQIAEAEAEIEKAKAEIAEAEDAVAAYEQAEDAHEKLTTLFKLLGPVAANTAIAGVCNDSWAMLYLNLDSNKLDSSLNTAVLELAGSEKPSVDEYVETMVAAGEYTVKANVDTYDVTVIVDAEVMSFDEENTLKGLETKTYVYNLPKGASQDDVLNKAAVAKSDALAYWNNLDKKYELNTVNYDFTETEVTGTLEGDLTYNVKVTPKEMNVTTNYNKSFDTLPFGYQYKLPEYNGAEDKSYDYDVNGTSYNQGIIITIKEDTFITRSEGSAKEPVRLYDVLAYDPQYGFGSDAQDILKNAALESPVVKIRKPSESLVSEIDETNGTYTITASVFDSGADRMTWVPYSVTLMKGSTEKGTVEFSDAGASRTATWTDADYDTARVNYRLKITKVMADDVNYRDVDETSDILYGINLPSVLKKEVSAQDSLLEEAASLYAQMNYYASVLTYGNLSGAKALMETEDGIKAIVRIISSEDDEVWYTPTDAAGNPTGEREYLGDYGGWNSTAETLAIYQYFNKLAPNWDVSVYYKDEVYTDLRKQATMLADCFDDLIPDNGFKNLLEKNGYGDKIENLGTIASDLRSLADSLAGANEAMDVNHEDFAKLISTIKTAENLPQFGTSNGAYAYESFTKDAPGKNSISVSVTLGTKTVTANTESFTVNESDSIGDFYTLTETDIDNLMECVEALKAEVGMTAELEKYYKVETSEIPKVGDKIYSTEKKSVQYVYTAKEYTVLIEGVDNWSATFKYGTTGEVVLPAYSADASEDVFYRYTIGTETKDALNGTTETKYYFANLIDSFVNGTFVISREEISASEEKIVNFIKDVNESMGEDNTVEFALANNNKAVVISVDSSTTAIDTETVAMGLAQKFALGSYNYVGFAGNTFKEITESGDTKLNVQSIIDMLLVSGLSSNSIVNGLDDTAVIDEIEAAGLGEVMGASSIQLGSNSNSKTNYELYLAFKPSENLSKVQNAVDKAANREDGHVTFDMSTGKLVISGMLPDRVYQVYLSALMVLGLVDIEDIDGTVDFKEAVEHHYDVLKPVLESEDTSAEVLENTLNKLGVERTFTADEAKLIDEKVLPAIRAIVKEESDISVECTNSDETAAYIYGMLVGYNFAGLIPQIAEKLGMDEATVSKMFVSTELSAPVEIVFENMKENPYEALVLDLKADGLKNKVYYTKDLSAVDTTGDTIVVLLKDIEDRVEFEQATLLNLNGKTIKGNVTANAALTIVDSSFGKGSVEGTVAGADVDVTAGQYASLASDAIADGYELKDGKVVNKYYEITKDDAGNITVALYPDYEGIEDVDVKSVALEIAADVLFDWYTNGAVSVDGKEIYAVDIKDVLDKVTTRDLGTLATEISECLNEEGVTSFANTLIDDLHDFETLEMAAANGSVIATYAMTSYPWNVTSKVTDKDGYIEGDITYNTENARNRTITVKFAEPDQTLSLLFGELDEIVEVNESYVELSNFIYKNGAFTIEGAVDGDVVVDFTKGTMGREAVIIMAVVLANGTDADADFVEAIQKFVDDEYDNADLKKYFDELTLKQITDSARAARSKDFATMVSELGLNLDSVLADELASKYASVLKVLYVVIDKLDIENNSKKLKGLATDKYATYAGDVNRDDAKVVNKGGFDWNLKLASDLAAKLILFKEKTTTPPGTDDEGGSGNGGNGGSGSSDKNDKNEPEYVGTYYSTQPSTSGVNTGDANNTALWITLMGLAVIAVVAAYVIKKRKAE